MLVGPGRAEVVAVQLVVLVGLAVNHFSRKMLRGNVIGCWVEIRPTTGPLRVLQWVLSGGPYTVFSSG